MTVVTISIVRAAQQFLAGSGLLRELGEGGSAAVPGGRYTTIMAECDDAVVPCTSGYPNTLAPG